MKAIKKISVVGAGAIGTMFGGLIHHHRPNIEVVMIARGRHGKAMQDRGEAELRGPWGRWQVPVKVSSDPTAIAGSDLVLITVKTQDTVHAATQCSEFLGNAVVLSLQNGINQRSLSQFVRSDRLVVGMTATNLAIIEPGVVELHRNGTSVIGASSAEVPAVAVEMAREVLASSGLRVKTSQNILGVQYNKLLFNTMGYASVISNSDFIRSGLLDHAWRNDLALPLLQEGMQILEASDISLQRASGMSDVIRMLRLLRALNIPGLGSASQWLLTKKAFRFPRIVFSVHQDLIAHRPTEIDYVNGEIVRLAEMNSIAAPLNAEVVRIIHTMEDQQDIHIWSHDEVIQHFAQLRRS